jgi:alkylation response protein AidB-like acyl-CoA dehydrogenase
MDFDLSKPQKMLQESVREYLSRHCSIKRVRDLTDTPTAVDDELWAGLTDQGWTALTIPEEFDGLGLGAVDLVAVTEAMGRSCVPGPFLSNLWGSMLLAKGDSELAGEVLPGVAGGEARVTVAMLEESADWDPASSAVPIEEGDGSFRITGGKLFVPDADGADVILVVGRLGGGLAVVAVDRRSDGVTVARMPAVDDGRPLYRVDFTDVTGGRLVARGEQAERAIHDSIRLATVAVCGELVGGMEWVLETAVEYARSREQFGRPIGAFQAVQHKCADILYFLESARSAAHAAAWAVSVEDADADAAVSVAKAFCSDAAREAGNLGIQVHGGIGFTWEHDLHLYYRRAKSDEILFGDAAFHRSRIAAKVIDGA